MRVILTINERDAATLLEGDGDYRLGRMFKTNDVLKCKISKEAVEKLIEQLKWLVDNEERER